MRRTRTHPLTGPAVGALLAAVLLPLLAGCSGGAGSQQAEGERPPATVSSTVPEPEETAVTGSEAPSSPAAVEPTAEPTDEPSVPVGGPAAAGEPSGTVPEGWEVVGDPAGPGLALPAGFRTQDLDLIDDVEGALHGLEDGSVLVTETRFGGALAGTVTPQQNLDNAVAGAIGGGQLDGSERRDFEAAGRPAAEIAGVEPSGSGAFVVARFVADGDALLGVVVTQADEASAVGLMDQVWDTVRLP